VNDSHSDILYITKAPSQRNRYGGAFFSSLKSNFSVKQMIFSKNHLAGNNRLF